MRPAGESFRSRVPVLLLLEPHTQRLGCARRDVAVFGLDRFAVGYDVQHTEELLHGLVADLLADSFLDRCRRPAGGQ
jgi:hypothetical protein